MARDYYVNLLGNDVEALEHCLTHLSQQDLVLLEISKHEEVHLVERLHHHVELAILKNLT